MENSVNYLSLLTMAKQKDDDEPAGLSKSTAVTSCVTLTLFYVAILYAPTVILRLPPPSSFKNFLIRRFLCAAVSSVVSVFACAVILPITSTEMSQLLSVYGIRADHIWQAVVYPLFLTSLMYAGSLVLKSLSLVNLWKEHMSNGGGLSFNCITSFILMFPRWMLSVFSNILTWRNCVVAPLTEELVFRACIIPLLLCGGFSIYSAIFLGPILFSLAHLNHFMEIYIQHSKSLLKVFMVVGLQLGYTVVFGSYASFLFIRTGHLLSPLVAHILCNSMGIPALFAHKRGFVSLAFVAGLVAFIYLIYPLTQPTLYNSRTDNCLCCHGYCSWN